MKLSMSNIAWTSENDEKVYELMIKYGYSGLEIAPTRIFSEEPYAKFAEAKVWSEKLKRDYGFVVPSMQSIWFGRQEKIFGAKEERQVLIDYTKKAIDFAAAIGCNNLVFGCPRNRVLPEGVNAKTAVSFFRELGDYAASKGTIIGMEANPPIYNTNYINDTNSAFEIIEQVDSEGFKLNLDVGTMIHNIEKVSQLSGKGHLINHVHISEPGLKPIEEREIHNELLKVLEEEKYCGFVSIEMGKIEDQCHLVKALPYWLLFRQGYCNVYLCLIFLLKGDLSVFMQHKKTDCHLSEKKVYLILRIRLHDTENLPLT